MEIVSVNRANIPMYGFPINVQLTVFNRLKTYYYVTV